MTKIEKYVAEKLEEAIDKVDDFIYYAVLEGASDDFKAKFEIAKKDLNEAKELIGLLNSSN